MLILLLPFTLETQISYPQGKQLAGPCRQRACRYTGA